jgi:hypothetical protein
MGLLSRRRVYWNGIRFDTLGIGIKILSNVNTFSKIFVNFYIVTETVKGIVISSGS